MPGANASGSKAEAAKLKSGGAKSAALRRSDSFRSNPSASDSDGSPVRSPSVTTCGSEQSKAVSFLGQRVSQDDMNSIFSSFEKNFEKSAVADGLRNEGFPAFSASPRIGGDQQDELLRALRDAGLEDSALLAEAAQREAELPLVPTAIQPFKAASRSDSSLPEYSPRESDDGIGWRSRTCSPPSRSSSFASLGGSFVNGGSTASNIGPGRLAFPSKPGVPEQQKPDQWARPSARGALQAAANKLKNLGGSRSRSKEPPIEQAQPRPGTARARGKTPRAATVSPPASPSPPTSGRKSAPARPQSASPPRSPRARSSTPRGKAKQNASPEDDSSSGAMVLRRSRTVEPEVRKSAPAPRPVEAEGTHSVSVGVGLPRRDKPGGAASTTFRRSYSAVPGTASRMEPLNEDLQRISEEDFKGLDDLDVEPSLPSKKEQVEEASREIGNPVQQQRQQKELSSWSSKRPSALTRLVGFMRSHGAVSSQASPKLRHPQRGSSARTAFDAPENAVILIDWDDTLLPTSFIKQVVLPSLPTIEKGGPVPSDSRFHADLATHARIVTNILRSACQVARVAIVTLATRWWVFTSAEWYFPGFDLEGLLYELDIEIWHADRTTPMVQTMALAGHDPAIVAKKAVMTRILKRFYQTDDSNDGENGSSEIQWNVLSIGDSTAEQEALQISISTFANSGVCSRPLCKTLKLRDSPSLAELSADLALIQPFLQRLVAIDKDFERTTNSLSGKRWSLGNG